MDQQGASVDILVYMTKLISMSNVKRDIAATIQEIAVEGDCFPAARISASVYSKIKTLVQDKDLGR